MTKRKSKVSPSALMPQKLKLSKSGSSPTAAEKVDAPASVIKETSQKESHNHTPHSSNVMLNGDLGKVTTANITASQNSSQQVSFNQLKINNLHLSPSPQKSASPTRALVGADSNPHNIVSVSSSHPCENQNGRKPLANKKDKETGNAKSKKQYPGISADNYSSQCDLPSAISPSGSVNKHSHSVKSPEIQYTPVMLQSQPSAANLFCKETNVLMNDETPTAHHKSKRRQHNASVMKSPRSSRDSSASSSYVCDDKKKNSRQPPIISQVSVSSLLQLFKTKNVPIEFKVKNHRNDRCVLLTTTEAQYVNTVNALKELKVEFITFTPKNAKQKSIVLKGLHKDTDADEIKAYLLSLDTPEVQITSIKKLNNSNVWIVQLSPDSKIKNLTNVKHILHQVVTWEHLRKQNLPQCRNCQRFGHIASNCNMQFRCVKCTSSHQRGQCLVGTSPEHQVQCILCNSVGHPASYKGCPVHISERDKFIAQKNVQHNDNNIKFALKINNQRQPHQGSRFTSLTNANVSYAQAAAKCSISQNQDERNSTELGQVSEPTTLNKCMQNFESNMSMLVKQIECKIDSFGKDMAIMKQDLYTLFKEESKSIEIKINTNSSKINFIMENLKLKWIE